MSAELSSSLLSPTTILWLVASVVAASILFAAINRRRARLTETLRSFVDRNQADGGTEGTKD